MKYKLLFLTLAISLFLISFASATECYQEFANISTECGGLDGGSYSINTLCTYNDANYVFDGNWETWGYSSDCADKVYINFTYEKPLNSVSATWQVISNGFSGNLTIPDSCFNYDSTYLYLEFDGQYDTYQKLNCQNETGLEELIGGSSSEVQFYEEAVIWNIEEEIPTPSPTPSNSGQVIYETMNTAGAGLGLFMLYIARSLPLLLIGIAMVVIVIIVASSIIKRLKGQIL